MNNTLKVTVFAVALGMTFSAAYGIGTAADPITAPPAGSQHAPHQENTAMNHREQHPEKTSALPAGLQVSQDGYTLDLHTPRITAGRETSLRFAIKDESGKPVTDYTKTHDKEVHLIVASHDLNTFRHLHPTRNADGTWSTPVELPAAGDYRVFADFTPAKPGATGLTLGADLAVAGAYQPRELPPQRATAETDGYTVTLSGNLAPGAMSEVTLSVAKDGKPVTDLEPYLGAYGHLVALRAGDLAYLHVHPEGEPGDAVTQPGPAITFMATAPTLGTYRLFLDFKHRDTVHTAAFTVHTGTTTAGTGSPGGHSHDGKGH
jgi:hypothetical protein